MKLVHPEQAEDQVALIRNVLERTTRFTGLPGVACLAAGALALTGAGIAAGVGAHFGPDGRHSLLASIWAATALVSSAQAVVLSLLAARRRGHPAWSALTRRVVVATLPGLYVGAVLTETVRRTGALESLPGLWCLAYGASLLGLGLYAGWKANLCGILFLLAGTLALLGFIPSGNLLMAITFGGLHVLLGLLILSGASHAPQDRTP